ncbi:hypothetical protein MTO96_015209 [Rhipicephalus appendiculatus]
MGAAGRSRMVVTMSLALLVALLVLQMTAVLARADPEEVGGNVVEALRLLEHLDKYYSHVNRPRTYVGFGAVYSTLICSQMTTM